MSNERRKGICLSTDILTDVFQYCSRKDLVLRVSRANSKFWHLSKNVPILHVFLGIKFWPSTALISYKRVFSSRVVQLADLPIPMPFIRFQNVSFHSHLHSHFQHNQSLQSFLESSKQSFVGSKLDIETIEQSDKVIAQTIEVLNTKLLDLYSIRLAASGGVSPDGFLSTTGVLNCDKVTFTKMRLTSDMIAVFVKWLYWKQRQKNSRRHLIFERCILLYDIVSWLKEVFLAATGPVNYVVSFVQCMDYIPSLISDMEFSLENKETGERMTMLKFREKTNRKIIFRFWRRIPVESDNQKNVDAEHLSMLSGKCAPNGSFDKDFYEF